MRRRYNDEYVQIEKIKCIQSWEHKHMFRYILKIPLKNKEGKTALVIMKNPSDANYKYSDPTMNKVVQFCYNHNYKTIYVMNLFAFSSPYPEDLYDFIKTKRNDVDKGIGKYNDRLLYLLSNHVDNIMLAWGGLRKPDNKFVEFKLFEKLYLKRINYVTNFLDFSKYKWAYVDSKGKDEKYPIHGYKWDKESILYRWIDIKNIKRTSIKRKSVKLDIEQ